MKKQIEREPQVVVCVRCSELKTPVAGAIKGECKECRTAVWVSPSSRNLIGQSAAGTIEIVCEQCLVRRMKSAGLDKMPGTFAPGALGELMRHFKGAKNN